MNETHASLPRLSANETCCALICKEHSLPITINLKLSCMNDSLSAIGRKAQLKKQHTHVCVCMYVCMYVLTHGGLNNQYRVLQYVSLYSVLILCRDPKRILKQILLPLFFEGEPQARWGNENLWLCLSFFSEVTQQSLPNIAQHPVLDGTFS